MTESMAADFVDPRTTVDLTNCDREPIHIPGAIQPNGVLLAFRESDAQIVQASANAEAILNCRPPVGATLSDFLGAAAAEIIRNSLGHATQRTTVRVTIGAGPFDATVHRSDEVGIVELENALSPDVLDPAGFRDLIRETLDNIARASTVRGLACEVAAQMRNITGFDRVWVYFFHEDWHGEIIGESMRDGIEPWLGLHYPASDIPAQARELFLKNWLRMIPDVGFTPVPLVPVNNPETGKPLDLGNSVLRSVSPIHIEYLTNMGVKASLVISLIHRGRLWGLISGHHYSGPKQVSVAMRTICEFLAQALSLQLGMTEQIEDTDAELEVKRIEARLREKLSDPEGYVHALTQGSPNLLDLGRSTGAAICDGGHCVLVGDTPPEPDVIEIVKWLRTNDKDSFRTTMLSKHYPPAANWKQSASGMLAIALSPTRPHYILLFKPEGAQKIRWAGDPNKPVTIGDGNIPRLSPRGSFSLWEEERRGISAPWSRAVIDAAADLRRTLLDLLLKRAEEVARSNAELEALNQQLSETAIELEMQTEELLKQRSEREELLHRERQARVEAQNANRAKADFLAMMSHELRTPLNAIGGYAQMLEMGIRGPVNEKQITDLDRIQQSQRHLLGLINNILNFARVEAGQIELDIFDFDIGPLLTDVESLVLPQLTSKGLAFDCHMPKETLIVKADPEKIRQILLNLLSNAIKFTASGGSVALSAEKHGDNIVAIVTDTGKGVPADKLRLIFEPFIQVDRVVSSNDGIGLGLAISRELARKLGGDILAVSEVDKGSTFTLSIPSA